MQAAIEVAVHPNQSPVVCEPLAAKRRPQSDYEAKFSLPHFSGSIGIEPRNGRRGSHAGRLCSAMPELDQAPDLAEPCAALARA